MESSGLIANIQHHSVNDGPGIRTTIFLKGCPLRCKWCHNPEMTGPQSEVWYRSLLCTSCGKCVETCPESAVHGYGVERTIDREICTSCMKCVEVCSTHAMEAIGKSVTVEDALREIQKDDVFYRRDNGGATLSGGEPLMQPQFTTELLKQCQDHLIHTVIETCGYTSWEVLSAAARYTDLILFDLKHVDPAKHKWGTGVSNELILENAKKLAKAAEVRIRVPVIPNFNDSEDDMRKVAEFMALHHLRHADLLAYHTYAEGKYKMLLKRYELTGVEPPRDERMADFQILFESYGLKVTIGG